MDLNTYAAKYFNEKDDIVDNPIKYLTLGELDLNTYTAKYFNEKDDKVDNPIKYLALGELDCTAQGELFDWGGFKYICQLNT